MNTKQLCVNTELRGRLFTEIMHSGLNQGGVVIPPELMEHANTCPACSTEFKEWIEKADVGRILSNARRIIRLANEGDSSIRHREGDGRHFYFAYTGNDPSVGTLVTTDAEGQILKADEGELEEFLRLA